MATRKKMSKKSLTQVNEVPLFEPLQQAVEKFLRVVKDGEWDDPEIGNIASALVVVFRPDNKGGVDVNVLNEGLGDEYQKLMTEAVLKAISGKSLFTTWG